MQPSSNIAELLKEARGRGYIVLMPPIRGGRSAKEHPIDPLVAAGCLQFKLSPAESQALAKLVKGDLVSKKELHAVVGNPLTAIKIVDVVICRLRKKLYPHDIKIVTVNRLGYRLDKNTRDRVCKQLAEHRAQDRA